MVQEMVYHPLITDLVDRVSYGTIGVLDCLAKKMGDNPNLKKNIMLVNGGTIVRNCYNDAKTDIDKVILQAISYDFEQLRHYFEMYAVGEAYMLVYFQPGINKLIPEVSRKKVTDSRSNIERLTRIVVSGEQLKPNNVCRLSNNNNVTYYGLYASGTFAYRIITKAIRTIINKNVPKIFMVSNCPVDFFLMDDYSTTTLISSHTGILLDKQDIPMKMFRDNDIPFNRITYKLFGDNDLIRGILTNRPKFIEYLKQHNIKLRLKTVNEIAKIASTYLGKDTASKLGYDL